MSSDYVLDSNKLDKTTLSDNSDEHSTEEETSTADEDFAGNNKSKVVEDYDPLHDDHDHVHIHDDDDMVKDVIMWRRRKLSGVVLMVTTAVWMLLQLYGFNFVPLASWILMAVSALLFSYGSILRLLSKDMPSYMRSWEMTEQRAKELGETAKKVTEKGIRWMFYVSCEREWYFFVGVISTLFLLAYVGHFVDLVTLLYAGTMVGMTVPVIYAKNEDAIKSYVKKVREQGTKMYHKFKGKVVSKLHMQKKQKKVE